MIRRLTPSPTETLTTTTSQAPAYLIGLRPRSLQDRILESLQENDLPLVGEGLDARIIQRLVTEHPNARTELIHLSIANYERKDTQSAEALLNYILSRLQDEELLGLVGLAKATVIDDSIIVNILNLMRLTALRDPLKFLNILDNSISGIVSLREFITAVDNTTGSALRRLIDLSTQPVSPGLIEAIEAREAEERERIEKKAIDIEARSLDRIDEILTQSNTQQLLINTGIGLGVTGLVWAGYRYGLWETIVSSFSDPGPRPLQARDQTFLESMKILLAGTSGFLLKKGLLRR